MRKILCLVFCFSLLCSNVFSAVGAGDNDANTVFLLQSEAADGTSVFTDTSNGGSTHTVSKYGSPVHSTTQAKFGSSSIRVKNTADHLYIPVHGDFNPGADAGFTIDFWFYSDISTDPDQYLVYMSNETESKYKFGVKTGKVGRMETFGYDHSYNYVANATVADGYHNAWVHVVWIYDDAANDITIFVNGAEDTGGDSADGTYDLELADGYLCIGQRFEGGTGGHGNYVYFEEIRISTTTRWTSNFTAPDTIYTAGGGGGNNSQVIVTTTM